MKFSYLFFDLDDTLLDHKKAEQKALAQLIEHTPEINHIPLTTLIDTYHSINSYLWTLYGKEEISKETLQRTRFERTLFRLGAPTERWKEIGENYLSFYETSWSWIDGAQDTFNRLREHFPVSILTNGFSEIQWKKIKQFGFDQTTEHQIISEEVHSVKPQPEVFRACEERCGVASEQILYIGDSFSSDVVGGKNAGWQVAWFTTSKNEEERSLADVCFSDFQDLEQWIYKHSTQL